MLAQLQDRVKEHRQWDANSALVRAALQHGYWPTFGEIPLPSVEDQEWRLVPAALENTPSKGTRYYIAHSSDWSRIFYYPAYLFSYRFNQPPFIGNYQFTQGWNENPEDYEDLPKTSVIKLTGHDGLDWGLPVGVPLVSMDDGVVYRIGNSGTGYGLHVRVRYADGFVKAIYAHMSSVLVKEGETVLSGQPLGFSGNTGNSTGPHFHLATKLVNASQLQLTTQPFDLVDPSWLLPKGFL